MPSRKEELKAEAHACLDRNKLKSCLMCELSHHHLGACDISMELATEYINEFKLDLSLIKGLQKKYGEPETVAELMEIIRRDKRLMKRTNNSETTLGWIYKLRLNDPMHFSDVGGYDGGGCSHGNANESKTTVRWLIECTERDIAYWSTAHDEEGDE
ncbi:MAG: hypothetical protein WCB79_09390 [Halobacteriota archaeon]